MFNKSSKYLSRKLLILKALCFYQRYILRNHLAQNAIESITKDGSTLEANVLLRLLENPFADDIIEKIKFDLEKEDSEGMLKNLKALFLPTFGNNTNERIPLCELIFL